MVKGDKGLVEQATRQLDAEDGVPIQWYFNDEVSMKLITGVLDDGGIKGIEYILKQMP